MLISYYKISFLIFLFLVNNLKIQTAVFAILLVNLLQELETIDDLLYLDTLFLSIFPIIKVLI